jgi:hypothetical protein
VIGRFFTWLTTPGRWWEWWFWAIVFLEAVLAGLLSESALIESLVFRSVGIFTKIVAAYSLSYYILPRLLFRRRYLAGGLVFVGSAMALTVIARWLNVHVAEPLAGYDAYRESMVEIVGQFGLTFTAYFPRVYFFAFIFSFIRLGVDQMRAEGQLARLREEKVTAELNFLKSQIHPHFLFNTLNNLYTLTLEKHDEAPIVVERLAGMLDYLLYQRRAERVALSKEIELLRNYGALESLRFGDRLRWRLEESIDDRGASIAPLLLISPLENAFKHGVTPADGPAEVLVRIEVSGGRLTYTVRNSRPAAIPTEVANLPPGIGLANVGRQLALQYPGQHTLSTEVGKDYFLFTLTINL